MRQIGTEMFALFPRTAKSRNQSKDRNKDSVVEVQQNIDELCSSNDLPRGEQNRRWIQTNV
jgi:hypothetical protein